ncbi:bifunctional UDP-N-acetylglucosamine diphosphorylase/glucosamine-1-phosphate N-acetyltransferase GlmU [Halonatronum saccharophilum]|uniref:bifunctional UDP-N-acetylglucosamine diphosphorylase/glucosamine-1-phosphate N-acetyltransferase GlmU n=1 Tax=Halonatronum saccharophilum TaxID=150060 RepID=UPI00047FCF85|nr:bifunctional UDP-N-acetylglucosamine diphosphorylase/glucosamine-1-phosphate N-acetyltransferase GlmU [Halonatronum saccharophilum]
MSDLLTITLAAGKGTRMKSKLPKVLHKVLGKSMVQHVLDTASNLDPSLNITVIGYKGEEVKENTEGDIKFVEQKEQLGTGHAVMQAREYLKEFDGTVLVLYGDTPLLTEETLNRLVKDHQNKEAAVTILTAKLDDPSGYGRIVRDEIGNVLGIVEDKDTTQDQAKIKEINTGICCFNSRLLLKALDSLDTDNAQGEYYLTDVAGILAKEGKVVSAMLTDNYKETIGVNSRRHLAKAEKVLQQRVCEYHMDSGVTIIDPQSTYIDTKVKIGQDTIIYPFTFIEGETEIKEDVIVGPQSRIVDSVIGNKVEIESSTIVGSEIGDRTVVGPYAYLRPGNKIGQGVKIGDFVEVKNSQIGNESKVPHLSYIGDTTIGRRTNVGAGTITANYDGENKHRTVIGDDVFIGSDSTLIAPIRIGDRSVSGAGSVITKDVKEGETVIGVPAKPKE